MTGATGFAGGHAVGELLKRGARLRVLARDPARSRLPANVEMVQGDLHSEQALDALVKGADAVVHLAGAVSAVSPHDYFRTNAHGTVAVAEAARRAGVRRFVHVSSLAAREPQLSAYGASKRAGEDAVASLMAPLNAAILRPPAVYGPGDKATLPLLRELTKPMPMIPGRRDSRFSLIHVGDLARLIGEAVENETRGVHEISDGKSGGYGWDELLAIAARERGGHARAVFLPRPLVAGVGMMADALAHMTGKPGMVSRGKVAELYHADWVAGHTGLALPDPITFDLGFSETLAWYRDAGWLPRGGGADRSRAAANKESRP